MSVDHGRPVPEDGNVIPGQRRRDDRQMNEQRGRGVAEIQQGKIEQVDNQEELALPEMASNPQHNEAKCEEIVLYASCQRMGSEESPGTYEDEVASNISSTCNERLVCAPQIADIVCLQDQNHHPVDTGDYRVQAERGPSMTVLSPYCVADMLVSAIGRAREGIVGSNDDQQKPGNDGEDFVGNEVVLGEVFALGERVP
jgi:hypothetical protein